MLHKILLFNTSDKEKAALIQQKGLELLTQVSGAQNVTFRRAIEHGEVHYKYLLTVDFNSIDDHEKYMVNEKHVEFSQQYFRPNITGDLLIQFFEDIQ